MPNNTAKKRGKFYYSEPEVLHISHTCWTDPLSLLKDVSAGINRDWTSNMLFTFFFFLHRNHFYKLGIYKSSIL